MRLDEWVVIGSVVVTTSAMIAGPLLRERQEANKKRQIEEIMAKSTYSVSDLNQDGISDVVIERNDGHKYPLFGLQEGDKLIYVPASEMEQRQKDAVVKVDYDRIEDLLNQQ